MVDCRDRKYPLKGNLKRKNGEQGNDKLAAVTSLQEEHHPKFGLDVNTGKIDEHTHTHTLPKRL